MNVLVFIRACLIHVHILFLSPITFPFGTRTPVHLSQWCSASLARSFPLSCTALHYTQVLSPMEAHKWFQYWRKCSRGCYQGMEMIDMSHAVLSDIFFLSQDCSSMRLERFFVSLGSKAQLWTHSWRCTGTLQQLRLSWHYCPPASCVQWFQINPESCSKCLHENL